MLLDYDEFESPIGRIVFASIADGVCGARIRRLRKALGPDFRASFWSFRIEAWQRPTWFEACLEEILRR